MRGFRYGRALAVLVFLAGPRLAAADEDTGAFTGNYIPSEQWTEGAITLPPWPRQDRLLEVPLGLANFPFTVYLDPDTLETGDDGVLRYALVLESRSGVWNASYEGMLCYKGEYRRYAYGSGGDWQLLAGQPWQRVVDDGRNSYRYLLYRDYLCRVAGADPDTGEILRRIRNGRSSYPDD